VISVVVLFGASGVFAELQDALNTVWEVGEAGTRSDQRDSAAFVVHDGAGRFTVTSQRCINGADQFFGHVLPGIDSLAPCELYPFAITTLVFGLIYKVLPDVKIAWGDVLIEPSSPQCCFRSAGSCWDIWVTAVFNLRCSWF